MPTLTSYTKSTEANILSTPPTADGEMAFSTDTKKLFISEGTDWVFWRSDKTLGKYQLGADSVARPFHHIDASSTSQNLDSNGLVVGNGGSVAKIKDLASGEYLEAETALQQPTLVSESGTTPFALPSGDARINGLPVWQFNGSQFLEPSIEMKRQRIHTNSLTVMMVVRQVPQPKSADDSTDSVHYLSGFSYTAFCGLWNDTSFTSRTDTNTSKYTYNNIAGIGLNPSRINRYEGDQGECSLITWRFAVNPYANKYDVENRHVSSLGSQILYGTSTAGVNNNDTYRNSSSSTRSVNLGGLRLGTNQTHSTNKMRGEIGEIIVWPESLSQDDYDKAGNYLSNKWGFTW